jgi:hypothetical protein
MIDYERRGLSVMKRLMALALLLLLVSSCKGWLHLSGSNIKGASNVANSNAQPSSASYQAYLPNLALTPGDTLDVTREDICTPGYSSKVRDVPAAVKKQAYEEYGITSHEPREYEVDHLISLELGGSNSPKNLWPESYSGEWNAHVKDKLENDLHRRVCKGEVELKDAQREIAGDWVAAYRKYLGEEGKIVGGK